MTTTTYGTRAAALAAVGGATLALTLWPRMTHWGATPEEAAAGMPGDELVGDAKYRTTHAVTVHAPPERIWPWLVQMGQGRGGMYSYDWLENLVRLDIHTADRIVPELQHLEVGDRIRMVPEGTEPDLSFAVVQIEPPRLLVLGAQEPKDQILDTGMPYPAWTFELRPIDATATRLVVRFQSDFKSTLAGWLMNKYALEPVHFLMERKMMLTLKERAERTPSDHAA